MGNLRVIVRGWGGLLSLVLLLPVSAPLWAQGDGRSAVLEEVVVTAQRREERLQDVPASVSALSAETLERQSIGNVLDLDDAVPNLVISQSVGSSNGARIYLRGIGEDEPRVSVDPAISLYVDGVLIGRQLGALVDMLDLERVEVLRGPQGTLYGRNTNAGAIKLVSKKPDPQGATEFSLEPFVGSEDLRGLKFSGNISVSDSSALRISALHKTRDGFFERKSNDQNLGEIDVQGLRLYGYREEDNWDASLIVESVRNDSEPRPANAAEERDRGALSDRNGGVYSIESTSLRVVDGSFVANDTAAVNYSSRVDQDAVSLLLNFQPHPNYRLGSITSYRTVEDVIDTWAVYPYTQSTDQSQFSQEFQLTSQFEGPFNYVAGLFLFNEDIDLPFAFRNIPGRAPFPIDNNITLELGIKARAVYAQGSYDLVPGSRLTAGLRYTQEEKEFSGARQVTRSETATPIAPGVAFNETRDWDNTSARFAFSQHLRDNMMIFASVASGFRSGSWSPDDFARVEDETVRTAEIGLRSEWFDNRLRANATAFFNDYEDLQLTTTVQGSFTRVNAGDVDIGGVELELTALLTPSLELSLVAGLLDAEYKTLSDIAAVAILGINSDAELISANADRGGPYLSTAEIAEYQDAATTQARKDALLARASTAAVARAESLDLKGAPEASATLSLAYNTVLSNGWLLKASGDLAYEDDSYNLIGERFSESEVGEKTLLNMRISIADAHGDWQVALWGRNLSDELYYPASLYNVNADSNYVFASDPRTYGVDFKFRF